MNSLGPKPAQAAQPRVEMRARVSARVDLQKGPYHYKIL
jgi:hypothetical protein